MSQNDTKPWERPWTTQEMIANASNWNLAGDSGLLKYLEDFSEKILSRVKDTNDRVDNLIDDADATSLALQNATNQFMGLRNTQFIESRVYEDDETLPTKQIPEKEEKSNLTKKDRLEEMKQAICNGLEIIDRFYEKVEIPGSDSEDDTDSPNILYRPVNPYIDRPLPYVIGTAEWHKYWHVGLGHSSSESEVENEDQFSETESEQESTNLPERDRAQIIGISDSESEDIPKNIISKPVANSTFNDNTDRNMFDSSSDSETGSLPPQVNTVNSNFAEELAAKLGKVQSTVPQPEVNTKPIKKQSTNLAGGLFSDEPPPLDEDDIFIKKNVNAGLFSGGDNLFDDIDDDKDFWNVGKSTKTLSDSSSNKKSKDNLFDAEDQGDNIFSKESSRQLEKSTEAKYSKMPSGLFDDDDDDLFSTTTIPQPKKTILAPFKRTVPLVSEEPPELESSPPKTSQKEIEKKKPVGGVLILGPNTLLQQQILKHRAASSSDSDYDPESFKPAAKIVAPVKEEPVKPAENSKITNIFDDTSPLFSDDIFNTSKKFTSNLFDSEPANDNDLFKTEKTEEKKENEKPKLNLFDDSIDDEHESYSKISNVLEEPPPISKPNKKSSLFDTNDDKNDLFSTKSKTENVSYKVSKKSGSLFDDLGDDIFNATSKVTSNKSKIDLFDPNPPDWDESDNKSESQSQFSLENEPTNYGSMNADRALLFDTEPPMLSNESSGIVRDQSNSRIGEDSSFLPNFTSTIDQTDQFQDQSDSLLTGKSKLCVSNQNLTKISESSSTTKIDITPSGTESSLFGNSTNNSIINKPDSLFSENDLFKQQKNSLFDDEEPKNLFQYSKSVSQSSVQNISEKEENKNVVDEKKKKNILFVDSGSDEDDLFSNKSSESKNSSASDILNTTVKTAKTLENTNIFEDDLFVGPQLDIFGKSKHLESSPSDEFNTTKSKKNNELLETSEDNKTQNLNSEKNKTFYTKKFNYEENLESDEVVKTDPKKSLSFERNVEPDVKEDIKEEPDGQILSTGSPSGKLKHSLNINVAALLPGASPPRRQNLEKSASLDSSENNQNIQKTEDTAKSTEKISSHKVSIEKSISFDQPINTEEILTSANKERVKIPVRRRPPSRRARQEAIRKSAADMNYEDVKVENSKVIIDSNKIETQNILNIANNNVTTKDEEKIKNPLLNPLSPSTDEEDFLTMPRDKDISAENFADSLFGKAPVISPVDISTVEEKKRNMQTNKLKTTDDLFDSVEITKEDLKKVKSIKTIETNKTKDLFGDAKITKDHEKVKSVEAIETSKTEDLFETAKVTKDSKKIESVRTFETSKIKDLFEDVDDIFVSIEKESNPKKADTSIFSSSDSENDLFSTSKIEFGKSDNNNSIIASPDEDLFKPIVSTSSIPKTKITKLLSRDSLFEDEDIFSTKKNPSKAVISKKNLFDDDDDDDDIFGGTSTSVIKPNTQTQSTVAKKVIASSRLKKMSSDTVQDIDDPLEALKK